jgi:magnesium-transporting ATPase (P-type)
LAIVSFAKYCGYEFKGVDENNFFSVLVENTIQTFQLLHVLEFNSTRKRMSVIIRDQANELWLYTKGADNIVLDLLDITSSKNIGDTIQNLGTFGNEGLRTLVYARRAISEDEYTSWAARYKV